MARDLLERYLKNVAKGLPEAQCEDIVRELREDVESEMEDKARKLGRPLGEAEQMAVLKERGNPFALAARYREDDRSVAFGKRLIGPVLFPFYVKVLSFNLGLTAVVIGAIFLVLGLSGQKISGSSIFSTCLWQLLLQFAIVTIIFTLVERQFTKNPDRWELHGAGGGLRFDLNFDKLGAYPAPVEKRVSRLESISIIVACAVALVWLAGVKIYPFLILGPASAFLKLAPVWYQVFSPVALLIVAEIVRATVNLVKPKWVQFRNICELFVHAGGLLVAYLLIRAGTWVVAEPV
ncbi:MAG TPA: hypothetical protein VKB24_02625, partial [Candidatus Acidoferrum sp.]|nr:hypothetical protein [Candidatus Acidoferrum sp.]